MAAPSDQSCAEMKTSIVASTIYRHNLKECNLKKYEAYLLKQKGRSKDYRQRIKDDTEKMKILKEKARLRQQKFRERKKEAAITEYTATSGQKEKAKAVTRAESETRRDKWRVAKKRYRECLSSQKKVWNKRKDRERKESKKTKMINSQLSKQKTSQSGNIYKSKKTLYNVTSKCRKALPKTPEKYALIINNLVMNATPRKRQATENLMESFTKRQKLEETEGQTKEKTETNDLQEATTPEKKENKPVETEANLKEKTVKSEHSHVYTRKLPQWYRIPLQTVRSVKNFYFREDVSTPLPQKRYANKHGPGYVMQTTLFNAFSVFKLDHQHSKIGFTKFASLRPKNVRLLSTRHMNYCVCLICQNVSYKLRTLNRSMKTSIDVDQLLDIILCPKSDAQRFHDQKCIFKKCEDCQNLKSKLSAHFFDTDSGGDDLVTWNKWEKMVEDGKARSVLKCKSGNISLMIEEFASDLNEPVKGTSFAEHLFVGKWQQRQFSELKKNLHTNSVLLVMDFGKNRAVRYQDEPKSVYFTTNQITIHPVVAFYCSPNLPHLIVRHSLVFLSDDLLHDHHAVDHYFEKSLEYLKETGIQFTKVNAFSDGCAAQYKGKGSFADLSLKNIHVERSFFGSDHGKSECDGEVGSINRSVDLAIAGRKVTICDAKDMYLWCSTKICLDEVGSKRKFFLVKTGEIDRKRAHTNVSTLTGCRKLHQYNNQPTKPYQLYVKRLSCYCASCRNGDQEKCPNKEYTGKFENRFITPTNPAQQRRTRSYTEKTLANIQTAKTPETVKESESKKCPEKQTRSDERIKYFKLLASRLELAGRKGFSELREMCLGLDTEINKKYPWEPVEGNFNFTDNKYEADRLALHLFPDDLLTKGILPVNVIADGNCLPRSASILAFGKETEHEEMRVRIVLEMCLYRDLYVDKTYLNRGENFSLQEAKDIDKTYTMFSEQYVPGEVVTETVTRRVYEGEAVSICKRNEYMGIWQLFALSSVLQKTVCSIYPNIVKNYVQRILNRNILPRQSGHMNVSTSVSIMWTSTRTDMEPQNWIPNHFVPVLSTTRMPEFDSMSVNSDCNETDLDISLNESMMEILLQDLSESPVLTRITDDRKTMIDEINRVVAKEEITDEINCVVADKEITDEINIVVADKEITHETDQITLIEPKPEIPILLEAETTKLSSFTVQADRDTRDEIQSVMVEEEITDEINSNVADKEITDEINRVVANKEITDEINRVVANKDITDEINIVMADKKITDEIYSVVADKKITDEIINVVADKEITDEINSIVADKEITDKISVMANREITDEINSVVADKEITDEINSVVADKNITDKIDSIVAKEEITDEINSVVADKEITDEINSVVADKEITDKTNNDVADEEITDETDRITPFEPYTEIPLWSEAETTKLSSMTVQADRDTRDELNSVVAQEWIIDEINSVMADKEITDEINNVVADKEITDEINSVVADKEITDEINNGVANKEIIDEINSVVADKEITDEINSGVDNKEITDETDRITPFEPNAEIPLLSEADTTKLRFGVGTHISIRYGVNNFNAVVVETPEDQLPTDEGGLWVQFFKKTRKLWTLEEKPFFVLFEEIMKELEKPCVSVSGSRRFYQF